MLEPRPARIVATDAPTPRDAPVNRATGYPDVLNSASFFSAEFMSQPRSGDLRPLQLDAVRQALRARRYLGPQTSTQRGGQGSHSHALTSGACNSHTQLLHPARPVILIIEVRDDDLGSARPHSGG